LQDFFKNIFRPGFYVLLELMEPVGSQLTSSSRAPCLKGPHRSAVESNVIDDYFFHNNIQDKHIPVFESVKIFLASDVTKLTGDSPVIPDLIGDPENLE
jgi:hypothetical protein